MRIGRRPFRVEWGHVLLVLFFVGLVIAYLLDARATSLNINNLLLVQPTAILALILCAIVLRQCFVRGRTTTEAADHTADSAVHRHRARELLNVVAMASAFGLFAFSLETIGFDIATWLFVAAGLYICGERRRLVLALFPAAFAAVMIYFFRALIPFPLPTAVL